MPTLRNKMLSSIFSKKKSVSKHISLSLAGQSNIRLDGWQERVGGPPTNAYMYAREKRILISRKKPVSHQKD